jgi:peptidyl-prolyl cis-trans isomerase B (cyclophilin B)
MRLTRMWQIWAIAASATAAIGVGCGKSDPARVGQEARGTPILSVPNDAPKPSAGPRLDQSFAEAVLEDSPGNQQPPVDATIAGQSTAKLRVEVQKLWDTIRFTTPAGQPIIHIAHFDTEFGSFDLRLLHEIAPNHVRNFVALAKAGYYDGLVFEQAIQTKAEDSGDLLEFVEGGCPVGTGEQGLGHLGYWLKPEFTDAVKHEPGTFGAWRDENPNSAGCRFYIALTNAPGMDGNATAYGKIVAGLDVVRTISKRTRNDGAAPVKPAGIRSVTIETQEVR